MKVSDLGWHIPGVRTGVVSGSHPADLQGAQRALAFTSVIISAQARSSSFNVDVKCFTQL